ncbi:NADPH-dependent diflavin oxidoreductase 1-like protein, partial [Drosera capensis]
MAVKRKKEENRVVKEAKHTVWSLCRLPNEPPAKHPHKAPPSPTRSNEHMDEKAEDRQKLLILYATETGNAMDAAERIAREAECRGCPAVSLLSIDQFDPVRSALRLSRSLYLYVGFVSRTSDCSD